MASRIYIRFPEQLSSRTPLDRRHSIFIVSPRRKCYFVYFDIGTRSTTSKMKLFTKTVSEPMKMELFAKVVNRWKPQTCFAKGSILDVLLVSEYASGIFLNHLINLEELSRCLLWFVLGLLVQLSCGSPLICTSA